LSGVLQGAQVPPLNLSAKVDDYRRLALGRMTVSVNASKTITARTLLLAVVIAAAAQPVFPQDQAPLVSEVFVGEAAEIPLPRIERGALMRAELAQPLNWSHVPKGTTLEATFPSPVYAREGIALPAGTQLRVIISSSEKVHKPYGFWKTAGRAFIRAFNPLEKTQAPEYRVTLSSAELLLPSGEWTPVEASVVRAATTVVVNARRPKAMAAEQEPPVKKKRGQILVLRLDKELYLPPGGMVSSLNLESSSPSERKVRAYLLTPLTASQNHNGDKFQAQLAEPVHFGDCEFKSGSLVEGTVVRRTPPRILSRAGKLYLRMDRVIAQTGERLDLSGTLSGAEADVQTRFDLDEEGVLRGRKPGLGNGVIDLGISYAVGKTADDLAETPIRALGASMGDAAVANAARYVGLAGALTYLVTRHGRDVRLPKYAEIEIAFGRVNQTLASTRTDP
jgi:hypothetical protein